MSFQLTEEQKKLRLWARRFAEDKILPLAAEVDSQTETSWEVAGLMKAAGFFSYLMPVEYGGLGIDLLKLCIIREELARVSVQASDVFIMSLLGGYPIVRFGSDAQKQKYLPPLARGEKLGSYALTEPGAGSDIASIESTARLEGDFYVLNGEKVFITNGGAAEVCTVYVKTDPKLGSRGISAFIFDARTEQPGLSVRPIKVMGAGAEYQISFHDYRIPKGDLLGEAGRGMRIALTALDLCRVTVGAHAVGLAQAAYEEALAHARQRKAFGQALAEFQAVQFKLADMATGIQAARLLVYQAAAMTVLGDEEKNIGRVSMAKLFATETAQHVVDEALQVHGGSGLISGSRIERIYRAVRMPRIYEGTSEIQRLTIARAIARNELES